MRGNIKNYDDSKNRKKATIITIILLLLLLLFIGIIIVFLLYQDNDNKDELAIKGYEMTTNFDSLTESNNFYQLYYGQQLSIGDFINLKKIYVDNSEIDVAKDEISSNLENYEMTIYLYDTNSTNGNIVGRLIPIKILSNSNNHDNKMDLTLTQEFLQDKYSGTTSYNSYYVYNSSNGTVDYIPLPGKSGTAFACEITIKLTYKNVYGEMIEFDSEINFGKIICIVNDYIVDITTKNEITTTTPSKDLFTINFKSGASSGFTSEKFIYNLEFDYTDSSKYCDVFNIRTGQTGQNNLMDISTTLKLQEVTSSNDINIYILGGENTKTYYFYDIVWH